MITNLIVPLDGVPGLIELHTFDFSKTPDSISNLNVSNDNRGNVVITTFGLSLQSAITKVTNLYYYNAAINIITLIPSLSMQNSTIVPELWKDQQYPNHDHLWLSITKNNKVTTDLFINNPGLTMTFHETINVTQTFSYLLHYPVILHNNNELNMATTDNYDTDHGTFIISLK